MGVFRDSEIERLVRELSGAWTGDPEDGTGVVEQVLIQPRRADESLPGGDDEVRPAPGGRTEGGAVLSLISVSGRRQEFTGGPGADTSLGRELARRTR